ncbi:site-specific integrase [Nocardia fluminea]|uniref:tyrosine-type recombinase/integrase n=1 Tax=Nocardia fluminea TaxID=134984 RepID=UPI001B807F52|nr:tyrosine-type recombinase/integrase [Nocardia fluminea]
MEAPDSELDLGKWSSWLQERLVPDWRRTEWDPDLLLFTGDLSGPSTGIWKCSIEACSKPTGSSVGFCDTCTRGWRSSDLSREDFLATYIPKPNRRIGLRPSACCITQAEARCPRQSMSLGLCRIHYATWKRDHKRGAQLEDWKQQAQPLAPIALCAVLACPLDSIGYTGLCLGHSKLWTSAVRSGDFDDDAEGKRTWLTTRALPHLALHQFSLNATNPLVRQEILYAVQARERRGRKVNPTVVRRFLALVGDAASLAENDALWQRLFTHHRTTNFDAFVRETHWAIGVALDRFRGIDPKNKTTWDLAAIGVPSKITASGLRTHAGSVDFGVIRQPWLRDLVMEWARAENPASEKLRFRWRAALTASQALQLRPGGGMTPSELSFADMNAVAEAFRSMRRDTGELMSASYRAHWLTEFYEILDFGRAAGLLADMSASFARHSSHRIAREDGNEDNIGKAIPEPVIAQLDAHLDLLAIDTPYCAWGQADVQAMFQTAYLVHRDTGRRPLETCGLLLDCLEFDSGEYSLLWDNRKGRRLRRRLPILTTTAETILEWRERRTRLTIPPRSADHLFPASSANAGPRHLLTGRFGQVLRAWVEAIPELHSTEPGPDGRPLPFDRALIFPYAFRHSYAQRHADAGIRVEVLKELMDHKLVTTTMGYFKVSLKRKREAIQTMRFHVVDRTGRSAPISSEVAYQAKSVAVPFGNCSEPSNVQAGGKACPIRFQCAGCGFYRPDPSYLPAVEDHVRSLKADRETARAIDADDFVVRNLTDQITAFHGVIKAIRERMDQLPADERRSVDEAAAVLRKVRAADGVPSPTDRRLLLPLTVATGEQPR